MGGNNCAPHRRPDLYWDYTGHMAGFYLCTVWHLGGAQLLVVGITRGALIAFVIFSISAVSIPMLLDRSCNVFDAIQTSWNAVRYNTLPMILWAGILVTIITAGLLTLYVALVIGFPLAAHATWHAYRDLVE